MNKKKHDPPQEKDKEKQIEIPPEYLAAIYARKSIKTDSHSIASQIAKGKELINEKELVLYRTYFDSESASKYTYEKREGFCELLNDLANNKFKTLVVLKRDRLSRKFEELLEIRKILKKYNIKVLYSAPGEYQPEEENSYTDFIENIIMGISEFEAAVVKERTSEGKRIQSEKGMYSKGKEIPFGFAENTDEYMEKYNSKYELVPHKDEAPISKKIFAEYIEKDYKIKDIVAYANSINTCKRKLNAHKIIYMLKNPTYAAIKKPENNKSLFLRIEKDNEKDEETSDTNKYIINTNKIKDSPNIMPILSSEQWFKAALKYLNNKREYKDRISNYLFKGLLVCDHCKKNISLSGKYYACSTKKCFRIKKDLLIYLLLSQIISDIFDPKDAKKLMDKRIADLNKTKNDDKDSLNRIILAKHNKLLNFLGNHDDQALKTDLQLLMNKESELMDAISNTENKISSLEDISIYLDNFRISEHKAEIIRYFKDEVNVDHVQEIFEKMIEKVYICGTREKYTIKEIDYGAKQDYSSLLESIY